jgi:hypothetical protein
MRYYKGGPLAAGEISIQTNEGQEMSYADKCIRGFTDTASKRRDLVIAESIKSEVSLETLASAAQQMGLRVLRTELKSDNGERGAALLVSRDRANVKALGLIGAADRGEIDRPTLHKLLGEMLGYDYDPSFSEGIGATCPCSCCGGGL